jgi:hypothetical protein
MHFPVLVSAIPEASLPEGNQAVQDWVENGSDLALYERTLALGIVRFSITPTGCDISVPRRDREFLETAVRQALEKSPVPVAWV